MNEEKIKEAVGKHFDYSLDFEFQDVVCDIVERALDKVESGNEIEDAVHGGLDDGLIYYKEQWAVLKHYCNPVDANWQEAVDALWGDVYSIVSNLVNEDEEEDEEDEEDMEESRKLRGRSLRESRISRMRRFHRR